MRPMQIHRIQKNDSAQDEDSVQVSRSAHFFDVFDFSCNGISA